jgi:dUTP pyrophosphatase
MQIKIKKLNPDAILPAYAHPGDAGLDLYSLEEYTLQPDERKALSTGIAIELEPDYVALVKDRSGLALKHGVHTLAGVIDAGYRGECKIVLINHGAQAYTVKKGDKIAQLLIMPVAQVKVKEVVELSDSSRGSAGFGSTGK